ncbi:hypothetical protein [Kiloniella litopenaei]|uniref:hypothetical protein n=1 Tax=Kiloniella litopenaei TaxID=1549748 RepID=UPI003BAB065F
MIHRNDWQDFYRQQVQRMGDLIHLPSVLPPRFDNSGLQEGDLQKRHVVTSGLEPVSFAKTSRGSDGKDGKHLSSGPIGSGLRECSEQAPPPPPPEDIQKTSRKN